MRMKDFILDALSKLENGYSACGVIDKRKRIYPLGSDTKVISTIFEMISRSVIFAYATEYNFQVKEPDRQNYYPDFTLTRREDDSGKIAIDVKTTYRQDGDAPFSYTLGSYTSYITLDKSKKNISYPYSDYGQHWIIGFVYQRQVARADSVRLYSIDDIDQIDVPFANVRVFMQEKWRIASDRAGSGNTANIGSLRGKLEDFEKGRGAFNSEQEFLDYWRGYKRTRAERNQAYSNVAEFRELKKQKGDGR